MARVTRLGIPTNIKMIVCMALMEPRKQQILLARAFAELLPSHQDASLWIVGDYYSDYSLALHQYLKRKGVERNIHMVPIVPDTYPWYAMADGFALLSDVESMPRALMEAMGFGLPVLSTRVFGIPELVDHGKNGLLVQANSVKSAVEGLELMLGLTETERSSLGRAAKEKIRTHFDSRDYAERCHSLIRNLVQSARSGQLS